jgi:Homeodomain-like domain
MHKKYIVRLSDTEREVLRDVITQLKGSSQKVRRAQILLKADVAGPGWTDDKSADAFSCRVQTVESIRQRRVTEGFEVTRNGRKPDHPPRKKTCDGAQEATVMALRLGAPPQGYAHWSLRLLADRVVELQRVETVCHETIRQTLQKRGGPTARVSTG